jgi:hypothetical protein
LPTHGLLDVPQILALKRRRRLTLLLALFIQLAIGREEEQHCLYWLRDEREEIAVERKEVLK